MPEMHPPDYTRAKWPLRPVPPILRLVGVAVLMGALASTSWAHGGHPASNPAGPWATFATGFLHPLTGLDHVVAMVAVGLWGAVLGAPALWLLPVVFPLVMALGGALALLGMPLPGVELGIALSGVLLGLAVLLRWRAPLLLAALLVGAFAVFHGHAHGTELPEATSPLVYSLGFVIATGLLHLGGVAFGALTRWPAGWHAVRAAGGLIAAGGAWFLLRAL
jgi:urease accessory protein